MSILIHYYHLYMKEMKEFGKIEEPEEVIISTNKYKNDNDKFNDFFEECVTYDSKFQVITSRTIHGLFSNWWISNTTSNNKVPEQKEMIRAMKLKYESDDYDKVKGFRVRVSQEIEEETISNLNENDY